MSTASAMSEFSVALNGDEMGLDEAVDGIFKDIQDHINECHVAIRNMCQLVERDDEYDEIYAFYSDMSTHIKEGNAVFKELIGVMKQVIGKPPKGWIPPEKRTLGAIPEEE